MNRHYTKYIFLAVAIANAVLQLLEKPIKISNWLSAAGFLILAIMHLINEIKKSNRRKKRRNYYH